MSDDDSRTLYAEIKQLGVKIDNLSESFTRAAYGAGFPRCAAQNNRIGHVEENLVLCHERIGTVKKWLIAGLVSVISMLANFVWNVLQSGPRMP